MGQELFNSRSYKLPTGKERDTDNLHNRRRLNDAERITIFLLAE